MANWGQAAKNWAQLGGYGAGRAWRNPLARSAMAGAAIGGIGGGYSDNSSVLGGAMRGALYGAGAYRYGGRALGSAVVPGSWGAISGALKAGRYGAVARFAGKRIMRGGRDAMSLAYSDALRGGHGAKMMSNQGFNKIKSIFWKVNNVWD